MKYLIVLCLFSFEAFSLKPEGEVTQDYEEQQPKLWKKKGVVRGIQGEVTQDLYRDKEEPGVVRGKKGTR